PHRDLHSFPTRRSSDLTAFDQAKFQCLTPGLAVTKECKVQAADGTNEVDVTLMNTGTADLQNCVVTDKVFPNDPTCPPTTTTSRSEEHTSELQSRSDLV